MTRRSPAAEQTATQRAAQRTGRLGQGHPAEAAEEQLLFRSSCGFIHAVEVVHPDDRVHS